MKLKLFSFMKRAKSAEAAESKDTDTSKKSETADGAMDDDEEEEEDDEEEETEGGEEDDEEEKTEGGEEETAIAENTVNIEALAEGFNAMGAQVEHLTAQVVKFGGDRSAEIENAASIKASEITASQGVPAKSVKGTASENGGDAPKSQKEFNEQYSKISDPVKAGAYFNKYNGTFS